MPARDKLTRWLDLIAALLRRRVPVGFDDLRNDVPAYVDASAREESILRTFERDKDELRALGIAIETMTDGSANESRYRLKADAFYLPYLSLRESALPASLAVRSISRPEGIGYQGLPVYPISPDERTTLRRAATRVRTLGNASLEQDAASALRKLEFDLGLLSPGESLVTPRGVNSDVFDLLGRALEARKRVTFQYHSFGRDVTSARSAEPYGLVFLTGHWYLVARDVAVDAIRQFRMSRISDVVMNAFKPQQADYALPSTFDLHAHTASRQAWELGDGDALRVVVRFRGASGQVLQALQFGGATGDATGDAIDEHRTFEVRRRDPFLRWLLTFCGDAVPVSPDTVVHEWRSLVHATLQAHTASASTTTT